VELAKGLSGSQLTHLDVRDCGITAEGMHSLAEVTGPPHPPPFHSIGICTVRLNIRMFNPHGPNIPGDGNLCICKDFGAIEEQGPAGIR